MKLTRHAPGRYTCTDALGREWTIVNNPQLGSTPWVGYVTDDKNTVLDPLWTLRETREAIASTVSLDNRR